MKLVCYFDMPLWSLRRSTFAQSRDQLIDCIELHYTVNTAAGNLGLVPLEAVVN